MKLPEKPHAFHAERDHALTATALVAWLLLVGSPKVQAEETTAAFLKIPVGARSASMGGATLALSQDAAAAFSNPAGLSGLPRQFSATDARLFADTRYDTFAFAQPVGWGGTPGSLGASVGYLSQDKIEARGADRSRQVRFSASDMVAGVSYARSPWHGARLGGTVKLVKSEIADVRATGWAADIGGLFSTGVEDLTLGLSARNLGPGMTFLEERSKLPTSLSAGLAYQAGPLTLVGDVTRQLTEERTVVGAGMEVPVLSAVTIRAGYSKTSAALVSSGIAGTGLGAGFGVRILGTQVDYSFTPMGELGNAQRISLSARF